LDPFGYVQGPTTTGFGRRSLTEALQRSGKAGKHQRHHRRTPETTTGRPSSSERGAVRECLQAGSRPRVLRSPPFSASMQDTKRSLIRRSNTSTAACPGGLVLFVQRFRKHLPLFVRETPTILDGVGHVDYGFGDAGAGVGSKRTGRKCYVRPTSSAHRSCEASVSTTVGVFVTYSRARSYARP